MKQIVSLERGIVDTSVIMREDQAAQLGFGRGHNAHARGHRGLADPQSLLSILVEGIGHILSVSRDRRVSGISIGRQPDSLDVVEGRVGAGEEQRGQ